MSPRPCYQIVTSALPEVPSKQYLPRMLAGIATVTENSGSTWVSIGDPLKSGHPRHPSRAGYEWPLQAFDVASYLRMVRS